MSKEKLEAKCLIIYYCEQAKKHDDYFENLKYSCFATGALQLAFNLKLLNDQETKELTNLINEVRVK